MFLDKLALLNIGLVTQKPDMLPADFGSMYYLYPSENEYAGFKVSSYVEKLVDRVKTYFKKEDEAAYYTNDFFC